MKSKFTVIVLLALCLLTTNVECNSEGEILTRWKAMLTDPTNAIQNWDPTQANPCQWHGVVCDEDNNRVIRLDLPNSRLSGTLSPELGKLTYLQYMLLEINGFRGTIPNEFGNLRNLISLSLSYNQLTGVIPASLGNLVSAQFLTFNNNRFTGRIPNSILQLAQSGSLIILNVTDNRLAGTIPQSIARGYRTTTIVQDPRA